MLAPRATPGELALDHAGELFEPSLLLLHVPPSPWTPFSSMQEPGSAAHSPEGPSEW
jgi:hypothetical protein